jgi:hypothetical protein
VPRQSSPDEEYCLALLLQHPELRERAGGLAPEYFDTSENREVFVVCQRSGDVPTLKAGLDSYICERIDSLVTANLPAGRVEEKFADFVLRLRKKFLQNLMTKIAEAQRLEGRAGGDIAELARLQEQAKEVSRQLGEVFPQKDGKSKSGR